MTRLIKKGVKVKIKSREEIESIIDNECRVGHLLFNTEHMYDYCGQECVVSSSWLVDRNTSDEECRFIVDENTWTWNLDMIEPVSDEDYVSADRICPDCGRILDDDEELIYIEELDCYTCSHCRETNYQECDDCGEIFRRDDLFSVENGSRRVCASCFDNYEECAGCGNMFHTDDLSYIDYDDCYYCDDCYDSRANSRIYGYHDYPRDFEFYKTSGEINPPYYIGAELEVENSHIDSDCIDYLYDNLDLMCSRDGSLEGDGAMEMVFDPRTPKSWYEVSNRHEKAFKMLIDNGYRSNDTSTCGLHFHVSRPYQVEIDNLRKDMWTLASDTEEYAKKQKEIDELVEKQETIIDRILLVMETYKEEMFTFSRRKNKSWCAWLSDVVSNDSGKITSLDYIKKNKGYMEGHGRALNLENHNTIEFRIFKGTLNFNTFMASLELVNNIFRLCSDLELPLEKINWKKLTTGEYVTEYVNEKNIHTNRKVVDTSVSDRIWNIIKNKKRARIFNKILKEFDKYYQIYVNRFDNIKNSKNWSLISETSRRLNEYAGIFKQVVDYKNNQEYDNLLYKISDMYNYNMYFDCDNEELMALKINIKELIKSVRK